MVLRGQLSERRSCELEHFSTCIDAFFALLSPLLQSGAETVFCKHALEMHDLTKGGSKAEP